MGEAAPNIGTLVGQSEDRQPAKPPTILFLHHMQNILYHVYEKASYNHRPLAESFIRYEVGILETEEKKGLRDMISHGGYPLVAKYLYEEYSRGVSVAEFAKMGHDEDFLEALSIERTMQGTTRQANQEKYLQ